MRRIDFWAGVPLCYLVTLADRVLRAIGMKGRGHGHRPKHILFIQLAEMGTMVVAYPALRKTRELFPDATLHFLCFGQVRSSLEMLNVLRSNVSVILRRVFLPDGQSDIEISR